MTNPALSSCSKKTLPRIGGHHPVPSFSIIPTERQAQQCTSAGVIYIDKGAGFKESCRTAGAGVCWDVGLGAVARSKVARWLGAKSTATVKWDIGLNARP